MFATRSIRKGETVFVERPVVASQFLWNALYNYRGEAKAKIYRQIAIFFFQRKRFQVGFGTARRAALLVFCLALMSRNGLRG